MKRDPWLEVKLDRLKKQLDRAKGADSTADVKRLQAEIHEVWLQLMALVPKQ